MNYDGLIKRIELPAEFDPPTRLEFEDIVATVLGRDCLRDDVDGINSSLELIRATRGGDWPAEAVTDEFDYVDLVWHECEFRERNSYSYVLYTQDGAYIGCCYFYPLGSRTPLSAELIKYDVDVSWWVTTAAYGRGYYEKVYRALRQWGTENYPFTALHFSNAQMPEQEHPAPR